MTGPPPSAGRSGSTASAGLAGLAGETWPQAAASRRLLVVPLGSTEQHGPHLPLGADTVVAVALAERLAAARPDAVVAPALPYGSSGEHAGFAGTLSLGQSALEAVVVELVRSADAFAGVVLVSGHAGNAAPLGRAVATVRVEGRRALAWLPTVPGGDAHAGRTETSLLLALAPASVRLDEAEPGDPRPLAEVMPELRSGGVAAVSPNGVLGDPRGANAAEGERLLAGLTADLVQAVAAWAT
ncbi:MAG TPA: mycofactocin biosynthesis peptidyl-dipeptidase MftE [Acidimicrobiales bacterium]|jgi:mycofactocin precursor peptide peptidase|nr:mycofactocin biosynthesis peptidyl-dipeptidase MftE [Acidimicrobiales bacterium]